MIKKSLQLYLFTQPGECDGALIAASDPGEANRILFKLVGEPKEDRSWECLILANEINSTIEEGIVLSSWNDR